jgi:hypothetical protein
MFKMVGSQVMKCGPTNYVYFWLARLHLSVDRTIKFDTTLTQGKSEVCRMWCNYLSKVQLIMTDHFMMMWPLKTDHT